MADMLTVVLNDRTVVEYDKSSRLPGHQRRFLDQMDADMDAGIQLGDTFIEDPDQSQRSYYIAMTLLRAILNNNQNLKLAACAYLGLRDAALQKIIADENGEQVTMQLVY